MAFQINLPVEQSPIGVALPEAYIRVESIQFPLAPNGAIGILVSVFASAAARRENKGVVTTRWIDIYGCTFTSGNLRQDIYTFLKTLPEFTGAVDVIEPPEEPGINDPIVVEQVPVPPPVPPVT